MPNPTPWIRNIPSVPRDDMDMEMIDRLTGRFAAVEAHVEPVRTMRLVEKLTDLFDKRKEVGLLARFRFPPGGDLAKRNHQRMTW